MTLPLIPAVITAGGRILGAFAEAGGTEIKALVPVAGSTLIERVVEALVQSGRVAVPIIVVGPEKDLRAVLAAHENDGSVRLLAEGMTGPENMVRGLSALPETEANALAILCTCDLPALTGDAIGWLLDSAPQNADIVFPILTKEEYEAEFPDSPGTYAPLEGEQFTGGSVFLVRPAAFARNRALIERVFAARKGLLTMAKLGGFGLIWRFLTRTLTVEYVETRASQLTGCRCRAVRHAPPSLAADMDTIDDLQFLTGNRPVKPLLKPNTHFDEAIAEARHLAGGIARETQEKVRETQERVREAQERAVDLARGRALEAQELARKATEGMPPGLLVRLASSVVGIPLLLFLVFAEGSPGYPALLFTFAVSVCAVVGALEYFRGLRLRGFQPNEALALIAIILLQFAAWNVSRNLLTGFLPALIALLVIGTLIYEVASHEKEPIANIGVTFFGVVYVGWLFSYLIFLRSLPGDAFGVLPTSLSALLGFLHIWVPHPTFGAWIVTYVFAVTWSTDAGAYFVGMRFGKRKLAPKLSPKKTVEGSIGGILAALLVSLAWGAGIHLPWWHCLILGPIVGVLGQIGDLCESALKRDIGVKDFGMVLPGHGGILDRFDSLLFTAPIAYYYLQYFAVHSHP